MTLAPALIGRLLAGASVGDEPSTLPIRAPFTGDLLVDLPVSTPLDVLAEAERLRHGQVLWAQRPVRERSAVLLRFHDLMLARRDEVLDIVQWETGKARRDAMEEVLDVCLNARHYARSAPALLRPRRHLGALPLATGVVEYRHPKGVVGIIAPWNYPLTLAASDALPALAAGNALLLRPDPQTSLTALWVLALLREAGLPDDAMGVVLGEGPEIGPVVVEQSDFVMFTGSTAVGRQIAEQCGRRLIGCSLELGGKNAMVVRADADPDHAAEIAVRAAFANAGQLCVSMERIYVHSSLSDAFVDRFAARTRALSFAQRPGWAGQIGPLVSQRQLERVSAHVDDARARGATVVCGGRPRPDVAPFAYEPTILRDVPPDAAVCADETFGPVAAVYPVASDEEAVRRANDSTYGLNAVVVSRSGRDGRRLATRLRAGTVSVNEAHGATWGSTRAPMGGVGDSGLGRRHGDEGLLKYVESQTVAEQRFLGIAPQFGWTDERWLGTLAASFAVLKRLGMK